MESQENNSVVKDMSNRQLRYYAEFRDACDLIAVQLSSMIVIEFVSMPAIVNEAIERGLIQ
jgi:hypothetical protein